MAAGAGIGLLLPEFGQSLAPIGRVFLKLIQSVIAPVLFGSLVAGIARGSGIGRLGGRAVLLFEIATTIALLLGWGIVWLTEPGAGVALHAEPVKAAIPVGFGQVLENIFPTSIFDAMAKGGVLQIVIFCSLVGMAAQGQEQFVAPFGVAASMAATVGAGGFAIIKGCSCFALMAWMVQGIFVGVIALGLWWAKVPLSAAVQARTAF